MCSSISRILVTLLLLLLFTSIASDKCASHNPSEQIRCRNLDAAQQRMNAIFERLGLPPSFFAEENDAPLYGLASLPRGTPPTHDAPDMEHCD